MEKLAKAHPKNWTPHHTTLLNNADAEKKCKKRNGKDHMASEELHLATSRLSYWHHLKKSLVPTRNIQQTTIDQKRKFTKIPENLPLTKSKNAAEHKAAQTTLKSNRANIAEYRRLRLERYAAAINAAANKAPGQKQTH
jgi:hypothetical protein